MQIQELEEHKPPGVKIKFDDPNTLHDFYVIISPEEGFWQGGKYKFHVKVRDKATQKGLYDIDQRVRNRIVLTTVLLLGPP